MGTFHSELRVQNILNRDREVVVGGALVDSGAEYTQISGSLLESIGIGREKKDIQFTMANGSLITRSMGFAVVRVGDFFTVDEVIFGEPGDLNLIGARTLEGFNARVDAVQKRLVAAGPVPAAAQR